MSDINYNSNDDELSAQPLVPDHSQADPRETQELKRKIAALEEAYARIIETVEEERKKERKRGKC